MEFLVNVVLPLSLAIIMLSLGIGLTLADFKRVGQRIWVFGIGAFCQVVIVPLVALALVLLFGLKGEIAAGVMLLSFCPGGVTSNIISKLAKGDVALSVSLTAVVSLLAIVTVPLFVGWSTKAFMGEAAPEFSVVSLGITMFLITALPVAIGMTIRAFLPSLAAKAEPRMVTLSALLFALIVVAALAGNWTLFVENLPTLGPTVFALLIVTMILGFGVATVAGLSTTERKTITIEVGLQNGTLGIALAPVIVGTATGIPAIGLASALYGVCMYIVVLPFVAWARSR